MRHFFYKNSSDIGHADPILGRPGLCECVLLVFVLNELLCCLWLFFCKAAIFVPSWNSRCPWPWMVTYRSSLYCWGPWVRPMNQGHLPGVTRYTYKSCSFWLRDRGFASTQISFACSPPPMFTESERIQMNIMWFVFKLYSFKGIVCQKK